MATNDFKAFATAAGANVTTQEAWETLPALANGFSAGKASSSQVNKALRQATTLSAVVGQFIANSGANAVDDGDIDALVTAFNNALIKNLGIEPPALGFQNIAYFTVANVSTWVVPEILRQGRKCYVVVIGGGASGAYGSATAGGTGGSSGGRAEKLVDLTGVNSVVVTVGAGGASVGSQNTNGNAGGTSSFGTYVSATGAPVTNTLSSQPGGAGINGDVNIAGFPGAPSVVCSSDGKRTGGCGGGNGGGSGKYDAAQQGSESERHAKYAGAGGAGIAYYNGLTGVTGRGADGAVYIYW